MLSHVETPACTGAAGIKLFGKVITAQQQQQQQPVRAAATPPIRRGGSLDLLEEAARARAAAAEARLACPRCMSRDTKFCYFNNYNVNQPRHFCRACHRYWTAGGALRNVPVGSGRRRNRAMLMTPSAAPNPAAAVTSSDDDQRSGSGSPPVFSAPSPGFFNPYHDPSPHVAALPASYNAAAAGLPEMTEQWWWLVTSTAERPVALDRAF